MHWLLLSAAIVFEVVGTVSLKASDGFSNLLPSVLVIAGYGASFGFLAFALRGIDVGTAYAIWSGVGTALVFIAGLLLFGESANLAKLACIGLIIAGVVGLHLVDRSAAI